MCLFGLELLLNSKQKTKQTKTKIEPKKKKKLEGNE